MTLINMIKKGNLTISLDCDLAILNNTNKNSIAYFKAFNRVKPLIIKGFKENDFQYQEIDIKAELNDILNEYNKYN